MSKKSKIGIWVVVGIILMIIYGYGLYQVGFEKGKVIGYEEGVGKLKSPKDGQIYRSILIGYSENEDRCYELVVDGEEGKYYLCRRDKWSGKTKFVQMELKKGERK